MKLEWTPKHLSKIQQNQLYIGILATLFCFSLLSLRKKSHANLISIIICLVDDKQQFVKNCTIGLDLIFSSRAPVTRYLKVRQNVREGPQDIQERLSESLTWGTRNVEQNGTGQAVSPTFQLLFERHWMESMFRMQLGKETHFLLHFVR